MKYSFLVLITGALLHGCIGTDFENDPIVGESLEITPDRMAILIGNSKMASVSYFNKFGVPEETSISWTCKPTNIATVDQQGNVMALAMGQAMLIASRGELVDSIRVSVVADENAAAFIDISAEKTLLNKGESITISAVVKNINEQTITPGTIDWQSSNENVLLVDNAGKVTALADGTAKILAVADGVFSNELSFSVSGIQFGAFFPLSGYKATGTASLKIVNGDLILEFSNDFETSFALGTFIYMANDNSNGTAVQQGGIELGNITTNGAHTWNVSQLYPGTTNSQYKYVIILCKPANVLFGYAQLF